MKKFSGVWLAGVFLVCGCGGQATFVFKGGDFDPTKFDNAALLVKLKKTVADAEKLVEAERWRTKLNDERNQLVAQCVSKLRKKPKSAADDARAAKVRAEAARELAYLADKSATLYLMEQAVNDKSADVRIECLVALGQLGDYTAVPLLIQFLEDLQKDVAKAALDSLNMICRPVTYREFTFSGMELGDRKKTAEQWWRWWSKGGETQLAKHAKEG